MVNWADIASEVPVFAGNVRARFESGTNKTLATLRSGGAPRISGTELEFGDAEITLGMMAASVKLHDVRRDPRIALHSPTLEPPKDDPSGWLGEAKLAGVLVGIDPPAGSPHMDAGFFRVDISEVVLTYVGTPADHLVIESWHAGRGWQRRTRV